MSSVLEVFIDGSFHTSARISSRVTTWPARLIITRSSSNSLLDRAISTPSTSTRREPVSTRTPPMSISAGIRRRCSARTLASSSAIRNGLAT